MIAAAEVRARRPVGEPSRPARPGARARREVRIRRARARDGLVLAAGPLALCPVDRVLDRRVPSPARGASSRTCSGARSSAASCAGASCSTTAPRRSRGRRPSLRRSRRRGAGAATPRHRRLRGLRGALRAPLHLWADEQDRIRGAPRDAPRRPPDGLRSAHGFLRPRRRAVRCAVRVHGVTA